MKTKRPVSFQTTLLASFALVSATLQTGAAEPLVAGAKVYVAVDNVCAWPVLTKMRDGSIVATIHNEPSHGLNEGDVDCWSSTNGEFWKYAGTPAKHEPETVRMNVAAGLANNGDLIVLSSGWSNRQQPGQTKKSRFRDAILRTWVCRSDNQGRTWQISRAFPVPDEGMVEYIPFGDIVQAEDGTLRTSCYSDAIAKAGERARQFRSFLFRSDDDGHTWSRMSVIGPVHDETQLLHLGGKRWLAAARHTGVDLFRSEDDGKTWQGPQPVTKPAELNGHMVRLGDGRIVLSYGNRINGQLGVCAMLTSDEGKTWSKPVRLADSLVGDCGYPSTVQRADGKLVTAWYSGSGLSHNRYHMGVTIWAAPTVQKP